MIQASGVRRGENILYVDEDEVRERLAGLPWIKRLNVERRLPHRLAVRIEERQPAALLVGERTWIVDADGKLVKEMEPQEFDAELLTIAGISAIENGGDVSAVERQAAEALVVVNEYRALGLDG